MSSPKSDKPPVPGQNPSESPLSSGPPPIVRITLASMEEANTLLQNGLDFYGATFFPTDTLTPTSVPKESIKKVGRSGRYIYHLYKIYCLSEKKKKRKKFGKWE